MARIVITRPNGETEYAALTTDKAQAGNDHLTVNKDGTTYYAKLDSGVSTHMFVTKPDGKKLYVQKTIDTLVTFDYTECGEGDPARLDFSMVNPKPKEVNGVVLHSIQKAEAGEDTGIILYLNARWTGTIIIERNALIATFKYKDTYSASYDVEYNGIQEITNYFHRDTPFKVKAIPG